MPNDGPALSRPSFFTEKKPHRIGQKAAFPFIVLACMVFLSWTMQDHFFLNWDISSLLHASSRMLAGGTYTHDFFTPNAPMILYLYVPPLLIAHLTQISIIFIFRFYIYFLISLSFYLSYAFIQLIFLPEAPRLFFAFSLALAVVFLLLPLYEFGQRDHLLFVFTMPYLFALSCQLQHTASTSRPLRFAAGLLAGIGFCIKPQFILIFLLLEFVSLLCEKNPLGWLRVETLTVLTVCFFYSLSVILFHADYLFVVIPFLLRWYYDSIYLSWDALAFHPLLIFCYLSFIYFLIEYRYQRYPAMSLLLITALIGFLFSYFAQHTVFYYHLLPALATSILLLVLLFSQFIARPNLSLIDYALIAMPLLFFLYYLLPAIAHVPHAEKLIFYLFISFILSIGLAVFSKKYIWRYVFLTILGSLFFILLMCVLRDNDIAVTQFKEKNLNKFIAFMNSEVPHQSLYVLSTDIFFNYPLVDYAQLVSAERFDCLWMMMSFFIPHGSQPLWRFQADKQFFMDMVTEDLAEQKPDLVFIDTTDRHLTYVDPHFNYIQFFSSSPAFRRVWQHYHYLTTLEENSPRIHYKIQIYKRK